AQRLFLSWATRSSLLRGLSDRRALRRSIRLMASRLLTFNSGRRRKISSRAAAADFVSSLAFQKREALARLKAGESQSLIARTYGVDRATISRLEARTS